MDLPVFCLLSLVFLVASFQSGEAVQCYVCNSGENYEGKLCGANFDPKSPDVKNLEKNCTELGLDDNKDYKRCRVMVQDVEGDVRIVRSCATWPDVQKPGRCVDRTGTNKIKVRYCECDDGDFCNGSSKIYGSISLILTTLLGLLVVSFMSR